MVLSKMRPTRRTFLVLSSISLSIVLKACQLNPPNSANPQPNGSTEPDTDGYSPTLSLYGAGATFPSFLYQRWFTDYHQQNPTIEISYQPIGSAAGIQQFLTGTVDFGASELTPTNDELAPVSRGAVFIPSVAGSIAVVYNIPGVPTGLKLSRAVLPAIFLGTIKQWNDPAIAALNPNLTLPPLPITVVHRSDGSGTTAAFTAHLSAISPQWQSSVGTGLNVAWKTGTGIKDNAGISAQVQQGEGVIGYVEYAFAKQLQLTTAALENKSGKFTLPTETATAAAIATIQLSEDLRGSNPDPNSPDAYPVVTYSWILAYQQYDNPKQAQALRDVLKWGLTQGQPMGLELGYVPLPETIVQQALAAVDKIGK
ncbi:MAG: phosphate ABC transporter substrate-binding protein PstS [Synechococcales cyanobacterium]